MDTATGLSINDKTAFGTLPTTPLFFSCRMLRVRAGLPTQKKECFQHSYWFKSVDLSPFTVETSFCARVGVEIVLVGDGSYP